jgi:hypothetical protein
MTCTLQSAIYDKSCVHCMTRKIISLRSPDKRTTLKLQMGTFAWMGIAMSERVKAQLKGVA